MLLHIHSFSDSKPCSCKVYEYADVIGHAEQKLCSARCLQMPKALVVWELILEIGLWNVECNLLMSEVCVSVCFTALLPLCSLPGACSAAVQQWAPWHCRWNGCEPARKLNLFCSSPQPFRISVSCPCDTFMAVFKGTCAVKCCA